LEEVVVTTYALTKKKDITGSVVTIPPGQIYGYMAPVENQLQGKAAGVTVTNPGAGAKIRIRGIATIKANTNNGL
jgi:hypothetical protein